MIENNTSQPIGDYPHNYVASLVELDYYKDAQELIKAEYKFGIDLNSLYWSGRVAMLRDKIATKKKIEQSLRDGTYNRAQQ